ncbi:MAG: RIP metalloprotease RseP [Deltaproteobacteria bacterium]|nr:RIP metalloprotease RseP [Deltaproteobacteria bacterium]
MLYIVQNLPFFLILIGPLVFVHELGHFLVAKWCGVRVLRFSLGFGPKLFGFTRGETEYVIAAVPLGGYVKMWGDDPSQELSQAEQAGSFLHLALPKRAAIVLAGPAMNLLLAALVYAGSYMGGVPDASTKLGLVVPGGPAAAAGLEPGDEITAIDGTPVEYWNDLQKRIQESDGSPMQFTVVREGQTRTLAIAPKMQRERDELQQPVMRGKIGISVSYVAPMLDVADAASPAALAGLKIGDEVTHVDGAAVSSWYHFNKKMRGAADAKVELTIKRKDETKTIALARATTEKVLEDAHLRPDPAGFYSGITSYDARVAKVESRSPAQKLGLLPGDRLVSIEGKPISAWRFDLSAFDGADANKEFHIVYGRGTEIKSGVLKIAEQLREDELRTPVRTYIFGAENDPTTLRSDSLIRKRNPVAALWAGVEHTALMSKLTLMGAGLMLVGKLSSKNVGGPVMLFVVAEKAATRGFQTFLEVMAMVSVSLGVMNLLPVPVLDGGHLVFIGAEAIRRKPLSMRAREYAAIAGLVLLFLLMAFAFINDFNKFILN